MLVEIWYNWKCIQLTTQELSNPGEGLFGQRGIYE